MFYFRMKCIQYKIISILAPLYFYLYPLVIIVKSKGKVTFGKNDLQLVLVPFSWFKMLCYVLFNV